MRIIIVLDLKGVPVRNYYEVLSTEPGPEVNSGLPSCMVTIGYLQTEKKTK